MSKQMRFDQFAELASAVTRELPRDMDTKTVQRWIGDPEGLRQALAVARLATPVAAPTEPAIEYFTPLTDADVPEKHRSTLAKYRELAAEHGVPETTAVCYRVRSGFTLKTHAAEFGPCHDGFGYLQGWNFPDEATKDAIVFWVPRILEGSISKTKDQQIEFLAAIRGNLELPAHHLAGFGDVALVAGLILAHFKATAERVPLDGFWARIDTCNVDGDRLDLDWFSSGLFCGDWCGDGADGGLGAFALGVELGS